MDPACSKRAQEPGRHGESCSYEIPLSFPLCRVPLLSPWQDGATPLMVAFEKQLFEIVQVLIAAGADVTHVMNVSDKVSST